MVLIHSLDQIKETCFRSGDPPLFDNSARSLLEYSNVHIAVKVVEMWYSVCSVQTMWHSSLGVARLSRKGIESLGDNVLPSHSNEYD